MIAVKRANVERIVSSSEEAEKWLAVGYEIVNDCEPVNEKAENPNAKEAAKEGVPDGANPTRTAEAVLQSGA